MTAPRPLHASLDAGPPPKASCVFCTERTGFLACLNGLFCCSRCLEVMRGQVRDHRIGELHAVEPAVERPKLVVVR